MSDLPSRRQDNVLARKEHPCAGCPNPIGPHTRYVLFETGGSGRFVTLRFHPSCAGRWERANARGPAGAAS
jgi:hypothetical protein